MTTGNEPNPSGPAASRRGVFGKALVLVVGVLALSSLVLASRDQIPAAPVFILFMAAVGGGLWWLADRGGRHRDRPVAGPLEAIGLLAATLGALAMFWILWDVLA